MSSLRHCIAASIVLALIASGSERALAQAEWIPEQGTSWQWQLSGTIDESVAADVYNVDLFETPRSVVSSLHAQGRHVICYMSAQLVGAVAPVTLDGSPTP
jgi:glycosyl hydrolase family 114